MPQTETPKLAAAFESFILDGKARRFTQQTIQFYTSQLNKFIEYCTEHNVQRLDQVTPYVIRAYIVSLQDRGLSDYSQHAAARSIKAFFSFAVRDGLLDASPMARVAMPKLDKKILPAFTQEDVRKIIRACETERDEAIVLTLLDTGVRATELLNLNGGDIDMGDGAILVRNGKGGKDRTVYAGARTRKQLHRYYMERGTPAERDPVFLGEGSTSKGRLSQSGLNQLCQRLGQRAGVAHCHPHTFRRTYAIESLRSGMSIYHLARLLGHATIEVLRQYLDLVQNDLKSASSAHGVVDNMG